MMRKKRSTPLVEPDCVRAEPLFGTVTDGDSGMVHSGVQCRATTVRPVEAYDEQPDRHEIGNRTYIVAPVEPLDVDGISTVKVGVGLWALGFLALLPFYGRLDNAGLSWMLWTCLAGVGLGLLGLAHCRSRSTRLRS